MPLTLTIRNSSRLENGSPLSQVLDRRGAIIGRAATTDWCLPDPSQHISSRHCEIRFADDRYELIDNSTNGTFLYGQSARLAAAHVIHHGDVFVIGQFEIAATLDEASAAAAVQVNAAAAEPEWRGWNALGGQPDAAAPASASAWDAVPTGSAISGTGPMSQNWAPPATQHASPGGTSPSPGSSTWDVGPAPPPAIAASDWSSPAAAPAAPAADDIWGKFAESNVVDWARGGFGAPPPQASPAAPVALGIATQGSVDSLGLGSAQPDPFGKAVAAAPDFGGTPPSNSTAEPPSAGFAQPAGQQSGAYGTSEPASAMPPANAMPPATPPPAAPPIAAQQPGSNLASFLASAGVTPDHLKQGEAETFAQAGDLLRRMIGGLVIMLEARARAKSQMGAQSTNLEFDGNNPLKFARSTEQAVAQLLNPTERGFMSSERAVEDAFKDLQAHQMATLKAMQGALRATLERFSPTAIRSRAETGGILGKILPAARDAALWNAYEREFGGVALGSDEAFMDMFAKEFRRAYEEISASR